MTADDNDYSSDSFEEEEDKKEASPAVRKPSAEDEDNMKYIPHSDTVA